MRHCIIHMGMHKTGSTSIQHSLKDFCNEQFVYARFELDPFHTVPLMGLFAANAGRFFERRAQLGKHTIRHSVSDYRADLERVVEQAEGKTLILSSEGIYSALHRDDLVAMKAFLDRYFDTYRFVAYVRPPASYLSSVFQQAVKSFRCGELDVPSLYKSYRNAFAKFDEIFGRERVLLWKFEPRNFPQGDVVRDFCTRLGIQLPDDKIVRANESLSRELIALLFGYHRFCATHNVEPIARAALGALIRELSAFGGGRFRFSPDLVAPVLKANATDISWIEQRLGESMQEQTEFREGDVRDESDLLEPNPAMASKLRELLPDEGKAITQGSLEELARLVHAYGQYWQARLGIGLTTQISQAQITASYAQEKNAMAENSASPQRPASDQRSDKHRMIYIRYRLAELNKERQELLRERSRILGAEEGGEAAGDREPQLKAAWPQR